MPPLEDCSLTLWCEDPHAWELVLQRVLGSKRPRSSGPTTGPLLWGGEPCPTSSLRHWSVTNLHSTQSLKKSERNATPQYGPYAFQEQRESRSERRGRSGQDGSRQDTDYSGNSAPCPFTLRGIYKASKPHDPTNNPTKLGLC